MINLINPNLIPEAIKLLKFIHKIRGKYVLSGQHNFPGSLSNYTNRVYEIVGKYPAIWGQDFGFTESGKDGIDNRPKIIKEAINQYEQGSIITLMWHAIRPMDDEPNGWKSSIQGKIKKAEWKHLITSGTALNTRWIAQIDKIADYLQILNQNRIPILWRPYHEMNGIWFWWGNKPGKDGYSKLWNLLYDRFTNFHNLNNLIWVWNANVPMKFLNKSTAKQYEEFLPSFDKFDILATDVYRIDYKKEDYENLSSLAKGKPIALGEVGKIPSIKVLNSQPLWTWFMVWCDHLEKNHSVQEIREIYHSDKILSREDIPTHFNK